MKHLKCLKIKVYKFDAETNVTTYVAKLKKHLVNIKSTSPLPDGKRIVVKRTDTVYFSDTDAKVDLKNKTVRFKGLYDVSRPKFILKDGEQQLTHPARVWITNEKFADRVARMRRTNSINAITNLFRDNN